MMTMSDAKFRERVRQLKEQSANEALVWWCLSFADDVEWLGACIVQARGFIGAVSLSHERGCNPGGEVQATVLESEPPKDKQYRLLSKEEVATIGVTVN
jgi:hypothetical protein